jgi:16S rRNA (cytosine967-C5)-methyltransferase
MSKVAPARAAAFDILLHVERGTAHSDELLHQPRVEKLSAQDRNLAMNLVMGTLRWQLALDARIAKLLTKPKAQLDPVVRIALRLGAFQLLYLDRVPVYAAIGESVELAKTAGNRFAAGMVNAVLRKVAAQSAIKETATVANTEVFAQMLSHPHWMVERWAKNFGLQQAKAICEYDQQPAPVFIRLQSPEAELSLQSEGIELTQGNFLTNVRRVVKGDVTSTSAFRNGFIRIQDEGSQLVAELAGNGQHILDACAAPGGKTAILAERNPAAAIVACDVSSRRLKEMQLLLQGSLFSHVEYVAEDVANKNWQPAFDLVLCDAPCSGTGTLARNPEIRYRLNEDELQRQQKRQKEILLSVMQAVKPGGRLLYSTCSLEPEENEAVVHACLERQTDFELIRLENEVDRLTQAGILHAEGAQRLRSSAFIDGCLRTLPGVHGCDGFFAALLAR